jgi:predicted DNA-binding transcriptional regulator AlpA
MKRPRGTFERGGEPNRSPVAFQLLRVSDVCRLLKISKPTFWRLRRAGHFPAPTELTDRVIVWRLAEIESWLAARTAPRARTNPIASREISSEKSIAE